MQILTIDNKYNNKKLSKVLLDMFPGLTLDTFYKALRKRDIRINNIRISKDKLIHTGDEIKVFIVDELLYRSFIPNIVYEDNNILIINKPVGIEVIGNNSLTNILKEYYHKNNSNMNNPLYLEPCHRLDRNTTGLILFAKNQDTLKILFEKFKKHEIIKHYLATVYGIPKLKKQTLTAYLFKDTKKSLVYISDEPKKGYVKIVTSYEVVEKYEKYSVLDVCLHTGKTHQIRAHLAHIGHPILGDGKYGNNKINKQFNFKTQQLSSYKLKFDFVTDAGILNYLVGKEIVLY